MNVQRLIFPFWLELNTRERKKNMVIKTLKGVWSSKKFLFLNESFAAFQN